MSQRMHRIARQYTGKQTNPERHMLKQARNNNNDNNNVDVINLPRSGHRVSAGANVFYNLHLRLEVDKEIFSRSII